MREDVDDELAHVVIDPPALLDRDHNSGEIVVGQDHRRRLAGHIRARLPHGDADIGSPEGRGVVHAVARHRNHIALAAKRLRDAKLRVGRAAGEHQVGGVAQERLEVGVRHLLELLAGHDPRPVADDADLAGDRRAGQSVVAGDDDHADAGIVTAPDRNSDLFPRRVDHRGHPEEAQIVLDAVTSLHRLGRVDRPAAGGEHTQTGLRQPLSRRVDPRPAGVPHGPSGAVRAEHRPAPLEQLFGRALGVHPRLPVGGPVDGRHHPEGRIEVKLREPGGVTSVGRDRETEPARRK